MIERTGQCFPDGSATDRAALEEALFRSSMWDGLRDMVQGALDRERWREVMMSALECDGADDPHSTPLGRLLDEVVFMLGMDRTELLSRLGRRMMETALARMEPIVDATTAPEHAWTSMIAHDLLGSLGVSVMHYEMDQGGGQGGHYLIRTVPLFTGCVAVHFAAFNALGDVLGVRFSIELVSSSGLTGEGNVFRLSW